ncbi:MAG TPA: hypothetical protein VGV89_07385 [Thermoplasmata archaeon]|nr:hypothetical protein [Thermoplasmata archaeon]
MSTYRRIAVVALLGILALSSVGFAGIFLVTSHTGVSGYTVAPSSRAPGVQFLSGPTCSVTVSSENPTHNAIENEIHNYSGTPGSVVCIGTGTFDEQLTINGSTDFTLWGNGNASTQLVPSTMVLNAHDNDSSPALPTYAVIAATNDSGLIVGNLGIDGSSAYSSVPGCDAFYGVFYSNSSGEIVQTSVNGINQLNGCQSQNAIFADNGFLSSGAAPAESIYIGNNTVSDYGKNGITCNDRGLNCAIVGNTVSTTAMPLGDSATNGIQLAWGADGSVVSNRVSGNVFLPYSCTEGNYFFTANSTCNGAAIYSASGILTYAAGDLVPISQNTLWDDQYPVAVVGNPAQVTGNTIEGGAYGVVIDFNATPGWLGTPVYAHAPYQSLVSANTIVGSNVGVLAYDSNVTVSFDEITSTNVSVESSTDLPVHYIVTVSHSVLDANVSGALLGDVSSFQPGDHSMPVGTFTVTGDTITNVSATPEGGVPVYGVLATGLDVSASLSSVVGFSHGVDVVAPGAGSADLVSLTVSSPATATAGEGIYAFAGSAIIQANEVTGYSWMNGAGWWPNSQATGIFAQCLSSCTVIQNSVSDSAIGVAVLSYLYGPFPAPSWPFAAPPSAGPISVTDNTIVDSGAFGLALELNQMSSSSVATPSVTVTGNTIDQTLSGAVGAMFDQGTYTVDDNVFLGTSASGSSGVSQPTGVGSIDTASIQVLNAYDNITKATLNANLFENTNLYVAVLNLTSTGGWANASFGEPVTVSETGLASYDSWSANVSGAPAIVLPAGGSAVLDLQNGSYNYLAATPDSHYAPTVPSGSVSVSGAPVGLTVDFQLVTYAVTFSETGLSSGTSWSVTLGATTKSTTTSSIVFDEANASYAYSVANVPGWHLSGGSYSGSVVVNGAPVTKSLTFVRVMYSVGFSESNLPSGLSWSVTFDSVTHSLTTDGGTDSVTFSVPNGTYSYSIADISGWHISSGSYTGSVVVNGAGSTTAVTYMEVVYSVKFSESGILSGHNWKVTFNGTAMSLATDGATDTLTFASEPNGTYVYAITPNAGFQQSTIAYSGSKTVNGAALAQVVVYSEFTYSVVFGETGLSAGTSWSVTIGATTLSSTGTTITFAEPNGTYGYTYANVPGWHITSGGYTGTVVVNGAGASASRNFGQVEYKITVVAKGLPVGKAWSVTVGATTISTTVHTVSFLEPNGTVAYSIGDVPGWHIKVGAYSGHVVVNGAPIQLTEKFMPVKYSVTFTESGLPLGTSWSVTIGSTTITTTTSKIIFHLANGTYSFTTHATGYTAHPSSGSVTVNGAKKFDHITFS